MIPVHFGSALANHLWQSTVFAGVAGLLALVFARQPRPDAALAVADRFGEVPDPVFNAGRGGQPARMAERVDHPPSCRAA